MAEIKNYKRGDLIFKEGDWGNTVYQIQKGTIGIYSAYEEENEQLLTTLTPGFYFGEMGIIDVMPRSATAVALENVEIAAFNSQEFSETYKNDPEMVLDIFQKMITRLRQLSDEYVDACKTITTYVEEHEQKHPVGLKAKIAKLISIGEKIGTTMI